MFQSLRRAFVPNCSCSCCASNTFGLRGQVYAELPSDLPRALADRRTYYHTYEDQTYGSGAKVTEPLG